MEMIKKYGPKEYLARIIRADYRHLFISFLKKHLGKSSTDISQSELLKSICEHRAVKCATALLEGEMGLSVDLNVVLEGGLTPLQLASRSLSFPLTELFLRHGAQANMRNADASNDLATLPLNVALNALCHHEYVSEWTTKESIFKLFFIFCLQDLREALDTIKLLASKTEDVEKTFVCHVEGVIQLAALVMVARDRIVAPFTEKGIENSHIGQHIRRQLSIVCNQEAKVLTTCDPNIELLELYKNKIDLLAQWEVLKIPTQAYDVLDEFRHSEVVEYVARYEVPFEVAYELYCQAGLVLTPEDVFTNDIKCLLPKLPKEDKDLLNESLEKIMASGSRMSTPTQNLTYGSGANPLSPSPSMACSPSRPFHPYQGRVNLDLWKRVSVKSQLPRTIQAVNPSLSKLLPSATASLCSHPLLIGRKCFM